MQRWSDTEMRIDGSAASAETLGAWRHEMAERSTGPGAVLVLYEVVDAQGAAFSPFVWRTRFALARKGLDPRRVGLGYLDIPSVGPQALTTVPILRHGEHYVGDSWAIADYLDAAFPAQPAVFASPAERGLARY